MDSLTNTVGDVILPRCAVDDEDAQKKKKISDSIKDTRSGPSDLYGGESRSDSVELLQIISDWVIPYPLTKRLTVVIQLPSGILTGRFSVRVFEDGCRLEITMKWPEPYIDL